MDDSDRHTGEFLTANITIPEGASRCDFGYVFGHWTNWCICDLRWYVGKGTTVEEANADMLLKFSMGAEVGRMKELRQSLKPKELDGRTREGKLMKSGSAPTPLTDQDLKDMF